jgi:hypothetical protein
MVPRIQVKTKRNKDITFDNIALALRKGEWCGLTQIRAS